jgi:hypothetical protein
MTRRKLGASSRARFHPQVATQRDGPLVFADGLHGAQDPRGGRVVGRSPDSLSVGRAVPFVRIRGCEGGADEHEAAPGAVGPDERSCVRAPARAARAACP